MGNIIKDIEDQLSQHPRILALIDPSIGIFDADKLENTKFINVEKGLKVVGDIYDRDEITITVTDDYELLPFIMGDSIITALSEIEDRTRIYDPGDISTWADIRAAKVWTGNITVEDGSVWNGTELVDGSINVKEFIDGSIYIPVDTLYMICSDPDVSYGFDGEEYFLKQKFYISNNYDK